MNFSPLPVHSSPMAPKSPEAPVRYAPFDVGRFGLIALGLGFIVAFAYFFFIATFADVIIWHLHVPMCGAADDFFANRELAYTANVLGVFLILIVAFVIECAFAGPEPRGLTTRRAK
jgi:hypothetical protein